MVQVSQPEMTETLTDGVFRFSGIPAVSGVDFSTGVSVGDYEAIVVLQARTADFGDVLAFREALHDGISTLITLRFNSGKFFLWAYGERPLYLGSVDSFPASIFTHRVINEMQHVPNAVQVGSVMIREKLMHQTLRPWQWQSLMSLADEVEFMDDGTYDVLMGGLWEDMGLTVYEVSIQIHIRYGDVP